MKIAIFDVENSPNLGWFYERFPKYGTNIVATEREWFMLSFAWKHPGTSKTYCKALPDYPGYAKNQFSDELLIKDLWHLFNDHDVLVGHNIKRFDTRKATARFLKWHLKPPSPCTLIDTLWDYKGVSYLDSYGLDSIAKHQGYEGKIATTGWDLHRRCIMERSPSAWAELKAYNRRDVEQNEKIWRDVAPFVKRDLLDLRVRGHCVNPTCRSTNLHRRGSVRQSLTKFQFECQDCGKWQVHAVGEIDVAGNRRRSGM